MMAPRKRSVNVPKYASSIKQGAMFPTLRVIERNEVKQLFVNHAALNKCKILPLLINIAVPKGSGIKYNYADITILTLPSIKVSICSRNMKYTVFLCITCVPSVEE